jgi:hypothetical protein
MNNTALSPLFAAPYFWGILTILLLWVISYVVTGRQLNPFALAYGVDKNYSASLLQFLIFTYLTVFAYVVVYVARVNAGLTTLPNIPLNLLVLMGLSVASATASKGIVVSYAEQGKVPSPGQDKSGITHDKEGNVALTKVQMLIWTFVAAGIYLISVFHFIDHRLYTQLDQGALPDVDGALLVLMAAAQGGYIGGKLVNRGPAQEGGSASSQSTTTANITKAVDPSAMNGQQDTKTPAEHKANGG